MTSEILSSIKKSASDIIAKESGVAESKKATVIDTAVEALTQGISDNFSLDNIGNLTSLFTGGSKSKTTNPIVKSLQTMVSNALVKKAGLNATLANTLSSAIVIKVVSLLSKESNKGLGVESLIDLVTSDDSKSGGGDIGNILSSAKSIFNKFK